jgi:hypothetical protein
MLETIADKVWGVRSSLKTGLGAVFPLRATVVRLADGGLWIHSPVRFSDAEAAEIDALGPVRHIVAPNAFHHLYAGDAAKRWPQATLSKAPPLVKKRPDLAPANVLGEGAPAWSTDEIDLVELAGAPMVREFAFFHRASGALMLTDSAFNITEPATTWSGIWFRMTGAYKVFTQSRIYAMVIKDKAAAAAAGRRVLEWPIRVVVPCHGECVTEDAHAALGRAWAKMLAG